MLRGNPLHLIHISRLVPHQKNTNDDERLHVRAHYLSALQKTEYQHLAMHHVMQRLYA